MSQTNIMQILKSAEGKPLSAEEIINLLKEQGEQINEQSFYTNMIKIEHDRSIGFKEVIVQRTSAGRTHKFTKKVWFYKYGARN